MAVPYRKLNLASLASESLLNSGPKSKARLEAEVLILRHQVNVLRRSAGRRARLTARDRLVFVVLYRLCPQVQTP
jgi:hypothetical protein